MPQPYELFTVMSRIEGMSNQFTKTDWKIVQYIKTETIKFIELSAQDLAKEIGTSDASIIRFAQKAGYSGLNELKYIMQKELEKNSYSNTHSDYTFLLNDYKILTESLFHLTKPSDIDSLRKQMLAAKRIFIVGLDFNKSVADVIAHKFMTLGLMVQSLTNYDTLKLYTNLSGPEDLFITISLSGNHKVLSSILAAFVRNDSHVVLVSNYEKSLCAAYSDLTLLIPKTDMLQSVNTISREILILMLFDMIFHNFLREDEASFQTFKRTVPYSKSNTGDDTHSEIAKLIDTF